MGHRDMVVGGGSKCRLWKALGCKTSMVRCSPGVTGAVAAIPKKQTQVVTGRQNTCQKWS
jgi:hypothetical protein